MAIKKMQKLPDTDKPSKEDVLGIAAKLREKTRLASKEASENKYEPTEYEIDPKSIKNPVMESDEDYDDELKANNARKRLIFDKMYETRLKDLDDELVEKYGRENADENKHNSEMAKSVIKSSIEDSRKRLAEASENIKNKVPKRKPVYKNTVQTYGQDFDNYRNYMLDKNERLVKEKRPQREYEENIKRTHPNKAALKAMMKGKKYGTTDNYYEDEK
jgi:hypothetical protein